MTIPLFDVHCDTISHGKPLRKNDLNTDLERLMAYSPAAQVFAIFVRPDTDRPPADFSRDAPAEELERLGFEYISRLRGEILKNSDIASMCLNGEDIRSAGRCGRVAALMAVEGAELIGCTTDGLLRAYEQGVRLVNITWNFRNRLSGTALGGGEGLTDEGRAFVRYAQQIGVAVDMSHISERAFWDTMEIAVRPIIAGHSNSKALCDFPRNLTDEQFTALVRCGGGAGVNLCTDFLGLGRDVEAAAEHIEHFLSLGGEKAVFLGSDLDGIDELPRGMTGIESMGELYDCLLRRNLSEDLVRDIFYNNFLSIFERCV